MGKRIGLGVLVLILVMGGYLYIQETYANVSFNALNLILSRIDGRGQLVDYDNEIGFKDIDDLGFRIKDEKVLLYYGKVEIAIGEKELLNEEFLSGLKRIGINIKKNKKGEYDVYYNGKRIEKWKS